MLWVGICRGSIQSLSAASQSAVTCVLPALGALQHSGDPGKLAGIHALWLPGCTPSAVQSISMAPACPLECLYIAFSRYAFVLGVKKT